LGDRFKNLDDAAVLIVEYIGPVKKSSSFYNTSPWGLSDQPDFLNRVFIVQTTLNSEETLDAVLECERILGRERTVKNAPRLIDIDILFFNDEIIDTKRLSVPHPEITNRRFVLAPLAEISPAYKHPLLNKAMSDLLLDCTDNLNVQKI
jgi:2-amino-4-hydroxy-6-hydroxymethyldihydropteridine diphosphokinase